MVTFILLVPTRPMNRSRRSSRPISMKITRMMTTPAVASGSSNGLTNASMVSSGLAGRSCTVTGMGTLAPPVPSGAASSERSRLSSENTRAVRSKSPSPGVSNDLSFCEMFC